MLINTSKWEQFLELPDWYLHIVPELIAIKKEAVSSPLKRQALAEEVYSFFEQKIDEGKIMLGNAVGIWDKERKFVDTIVIHHTEMNPGLTKKRLSAITLARLYATYYANPYDGRDKSVVGQPISSGHVRDGQQVFWPYHWIVRMNGDVEPLLHENEIGWHAGNWDVNCRSIAIVLDNEYVDTRPTDKVLRATAELIRSHYGHISKERIFGHREVRLGDPTLCPSNLFLSNDRVRGWKEDLLKLI